MFEGPALRRSGRRLGATLEVAAMTALLLSYIWGWQDAFPGHFLLVFVLYGLLGAFSHAARREGAGEIGVGAGHFRRALSLGFAVVGPPVGLVLAGGAMAGTLAMPPLEAWPAVLAWHLFWGAAQQYGLACFFYRRLREALGNATRAKFGAATLFALFHAPNPFLVPVTFLAGVLSCWIYDRAPNVWALGVVHGVTGLVLTRALPPALTGAMRVGPGYLRSLGSA